MAIKAEETNWQPIETAPKTGEDILVFCPGASAKGEIYKAMWNTEGIWGKPEFTWVISDSWQSDAGCFNIVTNPTRWMPLPEPPKNQIKN